MGSMVILGFALFFSLCPTGDSYTYINNICVDCDSAILVPAAGSTTAAPLLRQLSFSFNLVEQSIGVKFTSQDLGTAMSRLQTNCRKGFELEFAALDYPLEAWAEDNPLISEDLQSVPVVATASVVTFNLPEIKSKYDPDLVLSRENLYDIFHGNILTWNDHRIVANNPLLSAKLPPQNISVVLRTDPSGTSWVVMVMFAHMDGIDVGPGATSSWPPQFLTLPNRVLTQGANGMTSEITQNPYTFGVESQAVVEEAGLPEARLINRAGKVVQAGVNLGVYDAVLVAAELDDSSGFLNPGDVNGSTSYPLSQLIYLVYHTQVNADCDSRTGMAKFINWMLTDDDALTQIFAYPGFIPLPTRLVDDVVETLKALICANQYVLQETFVDFGGNSLTQVIIIFAAVFIMVSLSILTTMSYKRNNRITRAAGLAFALFFLLGCVFNYVSVIFWATIPVSNSICISRYAFVTLGYAMVLGAMFAKCWEVSKIFYRAERGDISPFKELPWWMFCRAFFGVVCLEALFLFTWLIVDPPLSTIRIIDAVNFYAVHECVTQHPSVWYSLHFIYFGVVLVWGAYLAYLTRDIWQKYNYPNESRSILLSIYNLAFCCVILVPLLTALDASTAVLFFLISVAILFPTTFALVVVHGPKMMAFLASSISKGSKGKSTDGYKTTQKEAPGSPHNEPSYTARILKKEPERELDDFSERMVEPARYRGATLVPTLTQSGQSNPLEEPTTTPTAAEGLQLASTWKVLTTTTSSQRSDILPSAFDCPEVANPLFGENV